MNLKVLTVFLAVVFSFANVFSQDTNDPKEIIQKYLEHRGDKSLVEKIETVKIVASQSQAGMSVSLTYIKKGEDKLYFETNAMGQESRLGMDGDTLWQSAAGNTQVIPSQYKDQVLGQLKQIEQFANGPFLKDEIDENIEFSGNVIENDRDSYVLKIIDEDDETESYLYIDKNNFEVFKIFAEVPDKDGNYTTFELRYKNYKEADGVKFKFPHTIEIQAGEQGTSTIDIETFEINKPVDDAIFKMPKSE